MGGVKNGLKGNKDIVSSGLSWIIFLPQVKHLRTTFPVLDIEVDGGVSPSTIEEAAKVDSPSFPTPSPFLPSPLPLLSIPPFPSPSPLPSPQSYLCLPLPSLPTQAGANMIVSGSAVVNSPNPKDVMDNLRSVTEKWIKVNANS